MKWTKSIFICFFIIFNSYLFSDTIWPISGTATQDIFTSPFRPRDKSSSAGFEYDFHKGMDLEASIGTHVHSANSGTVITGYEVSSTEHPITAGYYISIRTGNSKGCEKTYYYHLRGATYHQVLDVFNWAYGQDYMNCSSSTVTNVQGNSQELLDIDAGGCAIDWNNSLFVFGGNVYAGSADCPCMEITWFGSVAYCNYKSLRNGLTPCYDLSDWSCNWNANGYRLLTEAGWEYA